MLVTGGAGFVGRAVLDRLVAEGRPVRALARSDASAAALAAAGAEPVRGDILDPASLGRAMHGCEVVYHLAGLNGFCLPRPSELFALNVDGTRNVVRAAAAAGARRVVHTSSAATIGEPRGTVATERTPHRGTFLSHYERSKTLAEEVAFAEARAAGLELVSVNPASVQGPGRTKGTARILIDALNGRLRLVVDSRMSLVSIDDCAEGHLLAERRGAPGERYLLCGTTMTVTEALELLESIAGVRERPRTLPGGVALAMAAGAEALARARRRRPPVCREMVRTLLHGHAYDGSRARRELGLAYTAPREWIGRAVRWYADEGLVTRELPGLDRDPPVAPPAPPGGTTTPP
ncbi:NAD-dependent epimerase/dehydratase family protein [Miltoncostaea marina]|uniref:NAD-dependent epimerase/dehydratase family protein n=1 Tax=Miltoncostaea marina TaxID=2843215 RepID=UPI001C3C82BE|nr:NAD-dependent epimerase/dehydratase family protein [Miltoncostaea marina]